MARFVRFVKNGFQVQKGECVRQDIDSIHCLLDRQNIIAAYDSTFRANTTEFRGRRFRRCRAGAGGSPFVQRLGARWNAPGAKAFCWQGLHWACLRPENGAMSRHAATKSNLDASQGKRQKKRIRKRAGLFRRCPCRAFRLCSLNRTCCGAEMAQR